MTRVAKNRKLLLTLAVCAGAALGEAALSYLPDSNHQKTGIRPDNEEQVPFSSRVEEPIGEAELVDTSVQDIPVRYIDIAEPAFSDSTIETAQEPGPESRADALIARAEKEYERNNYAAALQNYAAALELTPPILPRHKRIRIRTEEIEKEARAEKGFKETERERFVFRYEGYQNEILAAKALEILDRAFFDLKARLAFQPERKITVILYTGDAYRNVLGKPDWSAGSYDGKIRIREGDLLNNSESLEDLMYHEYVHALVHERTGGGVPRWFNEGLAQYFEPSTAGLSSSNLSRLRKSPIRIPLAALDDGFLSADVKVVSQAYRESIFFVAFLAKERGERSLADLLRLVHEKNSFEEAIRKIYFSDLGTLEKKWKGVR